MKMKTKVIVNAAVSMAVCASLIAGSTFALFTSEAKTNIAITSGKVSVTASAKLISGYSAEYDAGKSEYGQKSLNPDGAGVITFTNGGTARYDAGSNTLSLTNITPGDGVTFNLTAKNESNVAIKYQAVVTYQTGGKLNETEGEKYSEVSSALYRALEITVGNGDGVYETMKDFTSTKSTAVSGWTSIGAKDAIAPISVTIGLPVEAGDALQGMGCEIAIGLYAVQSNGNDTTHQDIYFVDKDADLNEVFDEAESGDTIVLSESMTAQESFEIKTGKKLSLDMNGNDFTASTDTNEGNGFVINEGAELTLENSNTTEELPKFSVNAESYVGNRNDPDAEFSMRVDGALKVKGVEFNVEDKGGDTAVFVCGKDASITFDETSKLTMTGKDHGEEYGNGFGTGMIVSQGANVTLNETTLETYGAITPFLVGFGDTETKSTLTLNQANVTFSDMYNNTAKNTVVAGLQAYPGGEINIENSTITVNGSTYNKNATNNDFYTNAVALSCVGGGDITFENSTMNLQVEDGRAIAAQTITNYYDAYETEAAREAAEGAATGVFLHAHIYFKGTSEINGTYVAGEDGGGITMFAAQRNGTQQYMDPASGGWKLLKRVLDEEDVYSIIIESTVQVKIDKNDGKGFQPLFAEDESTMKGSSPHHSLYHEYDGDLYGDILAIYTYQAINDQRDGAPEHKDITTYLSMQGSDPE